MNSPRLSTYILTDAYDIFDDEMKDSLLKTASNNLDSLKNMSTGINPTFLRDLFGVEVISLSDKKKLLAKAKDDISKKEFIRLLRNGIEDFSPLFSKKTEPRVDISPENTELLRNMQKRGVIQSFEEDDQGLHFLVIK